MPNKTQSVERALDILLLFSMQRPSLALNEIAASANLDKSTAWRLTKTLIEHSFLDQDPETRRYRLGCGVYQVGTIYADCLEINNRASTVVHSLTGRTSLTARIGIWNRDAVVITMRVIPYGADGMTPEVQTGPRIPAYCTALGKVMLAFLEADKVERYFSQVELIPYTQHTITSRQQLIAELEATRQRNYSISREELMPGLTGIAAPIIGRDGSLAAAVSLSGRRLNDMPIEGLHELSKGLVNAALEISQELGLGPEGMKEWGIRLRESPIQPDLPIYRPWDQGIP